MTTTEIVWIAVIALAALVVVGLIVGSMRKRSRADNHARAEELRSEANTGAAVLPDATARADQAEAQAAVKRLEAERAERDAAIARTELDQQQALQEDRIRAADRLDPEVDHKAKDYAPQVATPAGPASVPAEPTDSTTAGTAATPGGSSVDLPDATPEPTDTSPRDTTLGTDDDTLRNRLESDPAEADDHPGGTDGAHRA